MTKFRIVLSGQGGELESWTGSGDEYEGAITRALISNLERGGAILTPGDTITIEAIEDEPQPQLQDLARRIC